MQKNAICECLRDDRVTALAQILKQYWKKQQYDYLHTIGCDVIQGYYLGKPQSVKEIEKLLIKGT